MAASNLLGQFLEFSLLAPDASAAWQRWLSLGFVTAEAGDVWPHSYGVVASRGLTIGLHAAGEEPLCISFVRAGVEELEQKLSTRLIGVERAQLGSHVYNLLELREPGGTLLRVQEARSFSAPADPPRATTLGRFRALSLPSANLAEARGFWERLDVEVLDIDDPWEGLALRGLPIACHDYVALDEPVLIFDQASDDLDDEVLRNSVFGSARTVPALSRRRHRLLRTPERLPLLLLDPAD